MGYNKQAVKLIDLRRARMTDMDVRVELNFLLDFYGPLLTPHRQEAKRLYCEEDLSHQELADFLDITGKVGFCAVGKSLRAVAELLDA